MESLEVDLRRLLVVDLVSLVPLLQKNLVYLIDSSQVEFVRLAVQPKELADADSTGLSWPIGLGAYAMFALDPLVVVLLLAALTSPD
jgi:hypothetical protein